MSENKLQVSNNKLQVLRTKIIRYVPGRGVSEIQPFLLLDVSGSMDNKIGDQRKIDILRSAVSNSNFKGIKQYVFSERIIETQYIPEPYGSTKLDTAFRYLIKVNPQKLLVVSDGLPDEPGAAIESGKGLKIPVDVLYIGNIGDEGEQFMKRLSETTGGKFMTVDTTEINDFQKNLTDGIKFMLYA